MKTILIIEDDEQVQEIYKETLVAEGYQVLQASTGQEGLDMMKKTAPDILVLDVMLPQGMNGFDVFEQIKQDDKLKNVPVLMLTNLDSEKKISMEMGASDYLVKANTTINVIVAKIKGIIG